MSCKVANVATTEHVDQHHELVFNYQRSISPSTLIFDGGAFVVRMYFDDHEPPHFHVLARRNTSDTLAKFAIETREVLEGKLPPNIRKDVKAWIEGREAQLLDNWTRCRRGEHPIVLDGGTSLSATGGG